MREQTQTRKRTPLTRVFSIIMALFMAVMIMPNNVPLKAHAATDYSIWILGNQVTSSNCNDILGSSSVVKFSYDASANTLHVKSRNNDNAVIETKDSRYATGTDYKSYRIIISKINNLTISIDNDVTFVDNSIPISYENGSSTLTLTGSGKLTVSAFDSWSSTDFIEANNVRFKDAKMYLSCGNIVSRYSYSADVNVTISNSDITANCNGYIAQAGSSYNAYTYLSSCYISNPENGRICNNYSQSFIRNENDVIDTSFTIKSGTKPPDVITYDGLKLAGIQVTSANKDSIGYTGASYDPDTKTLTLKNGFTSTNYPAIENTGIDGLKIKAAGVYTLTQNGPDPAVLITKSTEFTGSNRITIRAQTIGIRVNTTSSSTTLTISSPMTISEAAYGIYGPSGPYLRLNNSGIQISSSKAAVSGFHLKISLGSGITFDKPQPYNYTHSSGGIRKGNDIVTDVATAASASYGITVGSASVTSGNCHDVFGDGKVSYDPSAKKLKIMGTYTALSSSITNLTVELTGNLTIHNSSNTATIKLGPTSTITGSTGQLFCDSIANATNSLTISNICVSVTKDLWSTTGDLIFNNSKPVVNGDIHTTYGGISFNNAKVVCKGNISSESGKISISSSDVKATRSIYSTLGTVSLSNVKVNSPTNGSVNTAGATINSGICYNGTNTLAEDIVIAKNDYGIKYGNVPIDSTCDLNNIDGNNKVAYDPETKTLILKGTPTTGSDHSIRSSVEGLTIVVQADTDLTTVYGYVNSDIQVSGNTTIYGPGKLTVSRILGQKDLNFEYANVYIDHPTLNTVSVEVISTTNDINIHSSEIYTKGAIKSTSGRINLDYSHISAPSSAAVSGYIGGQRISVGSSEANGVQINTGYGFNIGGSFIAENSNLYGLGPKGALSYDPETNTISLNKDCVYDSTNVLIDNTDNTGLIINGNGHSILSTNKAVVLRMSADTVITGKLKINDESLTSTQMPNTGINVYSSNITLTIKDADINVTAKAIGIAGSNNKLVIKNSNVSVGSANGIYGFAGGITLDGCAVRTPKIDGLIAGAQNIEGTKISITPIEYYPLYVAGVQLNELNCKDIFNDGQNKSNYNPSTKQLWIYKSIESENKWCIDNQGVDGLYIRFVGEREMSSDVGGIRIADGLETTLSARDDLCFNGSDSSTAVSCGANSKLTISTDYDFYVSPNIIDTFISCGSGAELVFNDCDDITCSRAKKGLYCASGDASLEIIDPDDFRISNATDGAIVGFGKGINLRGCKLETEDCVFSGGNAVSSANNTVNSKDVYIEYSTANKISLSQAEISLDTYSYGYDGKEHCPTAYVTYNGEPLVLNRDYQISNSPKTESGTYTCTVMGKGDFGGSLSINWRIVKSCKVKYTANGKTYTRNCEEFSTTTITAPEITGKVFSCWKSGGNVVSTDASYTFTVTGNVTLQAVYTNALKITKQPQSVTVAAGESTTFSIVATGSNLAYQWYYRTTPTGSWKKSTSASGVTANYVVNVQDRHNGYQYYCEVKSGTNTLNSDIATLTVDSLKITEQPKSVTVAAGESTTFSIVATGNNLAYQWYYRTTPTGEWKKSTSASGITANYVVNVQDRHNGYQYYCEVKSGTNTLNSDIVTLTVDSLKITEQPKSVTVAAGESTTFSVVATGNNLTYQWYYRTTPTGEWKKSTSASGITADYVVNVQDRHNGYQYYCEVKNSTGSVNSDIVTLTVGSIKITEQPESVTVAAGKPTTFSIVAAGDDLSYQWYYRATPTGEWKKSTSASGTTADYVVNVQDRHNGYQYYCEVKNSTGSVNSDIVTLTIGLSITEQPKSVTVAAGNSTTFSIVAAGDDITYQWYYRTTPTGEWKKSTSASGTTADYVVNVQDRHNGYQYYCEVKNAVDSLDSDIVTLTVS